MDIKDKIKKLLALGTSPNENEAKAALLKAKQLMMDNKLTEEDIEEKHIELEHRLMESVKWTTDGGDIWMVELCNLMANNYLCTVSWVTRYRTHTLYLSGLTTDIDVCAKAIEFAVGSVQHSIKILQRKYRTYDAKTIRHSYAMGFVSGLKAAFDKQREEHVEWGLVEVKPQKVRDYENTLGSKSVRTHQSAMHMNAYASGVNDGLNFNTHRVLEG